MPPLNKFQKEHPGAVYYEGICIDEKSRIKEEKLAQGRHLLVKYGYTQEMARNLCKERGLLSPIYEFTKRGGVFSARMRGTKSCGTYGSTTRICGKK